jgi:hypothetical protein
MAFLQRQDSFHYARSKKSAAVILLRTKKASRKLIISTEDETKNAFHVNAVVWHTNTATFELDRSICSRDLRTQFFVYQQSPLSTGWILCVCQCCERESERLWNWNITLAEAVAAQTFSGAFNLDEKSRSLYRRRARYQHKRSISFGFEKSCGDEIQPSNSRARGFINMTI